MRASLRSILGILVAGCHGKVADDTAASAVCGDWSGVQSESSTWIWTLQVDTTTADLTTHVVSLDSAGVTLESAYAYHTIYVDSTNDETAVYRCDADGLWELSSTATSDVTNSEAGETVNTKVTTYETPFLVLPAALAMGDTWQATATGTVEESATGATHAFDYTSNATVADEIDVSVAAGDYRALRVDREEVGATLQSWYAQGVGLVAADDRELRSYSP